MEVERSRGLEKAALDCQKQLLSLEEEIDEMSERLLYEKFKHVDVKCNLSGTIHDLQVKHEALLDTKSMLEAEIEAS
ncbi:hypothetical protein HAX54_017377 [Datura stramonium]|uniref:Uncharacterized protein n=1 Tax=Datura stramonium TaxID=4076 RepID=A0ABS8S170_DATST|nr:hypothetical protein [Datura stramonium]